MLALGALQGAVGWLMVKSGLVDRVDVSQYRLALHLSIAFLILALLLWLAFDLDDGAGSARVALLSAWSDAARRCDRLRLVFVQVMLGALVAGLKAGLAYNTWPLMDGALVPEGLGAALALVSEFLRERDDGAVQSPAHGVCGDGARAVAGVEHRGERLRDSCTCTLGDVARGGGPCVRWAWDLDAARGGAVLARTSHTRPVLRSFSASP